MHRHILIPTDGSELSQNAIDYGMALAKSVNAKVTVLTVSTPFPTFAVEPGMVIDTPEQYGKRMATLAANYLKVAKEAAAAAGVSCETMHIEHDQPYLAIIETAARRLCDLIVMASHGRRGISAIVLGSETVKVLTHSTIPVLVFRAPHQGIFTALASLT
ncbi:universal stress protein [Bradyrhizobium sediminis]|uniref:Universal stress protein n=1 Tax=Bradyrhizobium sediminis TaxID=2840469 RepID=A0A975RUN8_9BRAD|nr:universal stress protein [Bradyrhizobium sediminis]QWG20233.1 universal stress protein [Bradyrhizobium sediminis]